MNVSVKSARVIQKKSKVNKEKNKKKNKKKKSIEKASKVLSTYSNIVFNDNYDPEDDVNIYRFSMDRAIAISPRRDDTRENPREFQIYSPFLFITTGYVIESSPLLQLIQMGIIIQDGTENINGISYNRYRFFKELQDDRPYDYTPEDGYTLKSFDEMTEEEQSALNENDCLQVGESFNVAISTNSMDDFLTHLRADETPPEYCEKSTSFLFGNSFKGNKEAITFSTQNNDAALPIPGEAYTIVRKNPSKHTDKAPFHIAYVIYQHLGLNITLEAEAEAGPRYIPTFAFYDINPKGNTFHKFWSGQQDRTSELYSDSITIVLTDHKKHTPTHTLTSRQKSMKNGGSKRKIIKRKSKTRKTR